MDNMGNHERPPASGRRLKTWVCALPTKVEVADAAEPDYKDSSIKFGNSLARLFWLSSAACDVHGNEECPASRCLLWRAGPQARCCGGAPDAAKARSRARDLRRRQPAFHRRNDLP